MKVIKKVVRTSLVLALMGGSSVFAQSIIDVKQAIDAEQYHKASTTLKAMISSKPADAQNYFYLGNLYLRSGYVDSAQTVYTKGIAADANFPLNYVGLGALALKANNSALAETNFKKAIDQAGKKNNDPYIYVAKAYIAAPKPNYAAAVTHLQKAIDLNAKDAEAHLALGDAYRGQEKITEAFSAYRTAYDLNEKLLRAKIELGVINRRAQAFQESLDEFNNVLKINPNYGPAYREMAETYLRWANSGDSKGYHETINKALSSYVKYMDLTDRSLESRMRYADFLILAKEYKTLEREAQEMAKLDKTNPRIYRYLGYSAFENENYTASIAAINTFMTRVEKDRLIPLDYVYLAKAQLKSGDVVNGLSNLKIAVSLDSTTSVEGLGVIAKELYMAKKYDLAAQVYDLTQSSANPDLTDYYWQGNAYYWDYVTKFNEKANPSKDLLVKADSAYARLLQRSPTTEIAILQRASVASLLDEDNTKFLATEPYEKFIEVVTVTKPERAHIPGNKAGLVKAYNYLAAVAAIRDKNASKAKDYYNKTLQIDPSNAIAQEGLKSLASQ